ncbi:MAG: AAA family ATPase, partial [Verrucomicrobiales bacterium]|nr:AAA family ATPase [Verrucomicrobiales bacterium]
MNLYIPVFSERIHRQEKGKTYRLRPAFPSMPWKERDDFVVYNPREDRALEELTRILRRYFSELAKDMRHDSLIRWSFFPDLKGVKIPVQMFLRKQSVNGEIFAVTYSALGRRIVTMPKLPGLTFDLERGDRLEDRANEVLTKYFRKQERQSDERLDLDQYLSSGQTHLTMIELPVRTRQKYVKPEPPGFALLGGSEKMSGAQELENVGRCMNRLFPTRLSRAILRDSKVEALAEHFHKSSKSPQPLVLTGPGQVGKSAVIQEYLYRRIYEEEKPLREIWLISPQRMISGMSFVGQWEERAHAIFQEARKRKHILLFEDLPGLFQAGKTRDSDLTIGQVLKAYFEEGGIQVLAEATPESWRKLREIDRGFADFFRTLPIEETSQKDTLRILVRTIQEIESKERGTYFEPDLIPAVYELQNRFARSSAFPGKAVEVIQQISHKYSGRELDREDVFAFFQSKTGIQRQFLRQRHRIEPGEISAFFNDRIKGQPAAVEAMTKLVVSCVSQLNEPGRPMGSLLFLGPTGVGKTECAKAIAEYFFGTSERLLRFDMNEFVGPDAAERLIGSSFRPRGLLTGGVRRQPFAVILLDEIEKAHVRVFDLLLQLLEDGRLTDAAGETADFCNCIIVMTSNLGARSARHQLGFGKAGIQDVQVYREAAEKFFRPEMFNRLDHIVPFGELSRHDIESLVALMSQKALSRIGLTETQLSLKIQPEVYARLAEMGFKPDFGARALRRSVEEFLIEPIALRISELPKNQPAVVTCSCSETGGLTFQSIELKAAQAGGWITNHFPLSSCDDFIDQINEFLDRIEDNLESWRDESNGVIDPSDPVQIRYFSLREDIMGIRRMRDHFEVAVENELRYRRDHPDKPSPHQTGDNYRFLPDHDPGQFLREMYQTTDSGRYVVKSIEKSEPFDHIRQIVSDIINRANSLDMIVSSNPSVEDRC